MAGAWGWQPYHLRLLIVLKSGSLNLLEPSGPVQACNGIALPFTLRSMLQRTMEILDVFLYVLGAGKAVRDYRLSHGLDNREIMDWFPGGDRIFSSSPEFLDWCWSPPTSRLVGTRGFFSWVKWPQVWSWPPGPSCVKFKNEWNCISAPPYTFMPWAVTSLPFPMCLIIAAVLQDAASRRHSA
jgi:hypothetical protein